ncbi:MAG: hypothetical protein CMJ58_14275 [Planctomycetaceae bacterium]|nr:hypothetical protein [Planctomycetaceae bacterium]
MVFQLSVSSTAVAKPIALRGLRQPARLTSCILKVSFSMPGLLKKFLSNNKLYGRDMSPADEQELRRISALLEQVDKSLADGSPLREALVKAGLALSIAFIDGRRAWIEDTYAHLDGDLTDEQRAHLVRLGIDPDAERPAV